MNDKMTVQALEERIGQMEARIRRLEEQLESAARTETQPATQPIQLVAPLEIRDSEGRLLLDLHVERNDRSVRLFNAGGHVAAALGVDGTNGGYLALRNYEGELVGLWDVESYGGRLQVLGNQGGGVFLHGGEAGNDDAGGQIIITTPEQIDGVYPSNAGHLFISTDSEGAEVEIEGKQLVIRLGDVTFTSGDIGR